MARGRKSYTLEEQLEMVTADIENMEGALKELKKTKKELESKVKKEQLVKLDALIAERGLSYEEVEEMLNK